MVTAPVSPNSTGIMPPRRLDPRTILVGTLRGAPSLILGVPLVLAWSQREGVSLVSLFIGMTVLLLIAVTTAWVRWRTFTYQILPGEVVIAQGLIKKSRRSIPFERIQDISIKRGPLSRLIGIAEVRIETGGGETDEGRLVSVSLPEAHRLREVFRATRAGGRAVDAAAVEHGSATEVKLFQMGVARLLFSGLFNFSLVGLAAIFGLLQYLEQLPGYGWDWLLERVGIAEQIVRSRLDETILLAGAGAAAAAAFGLLAGMGQTVLRDFGFTLIHDEGRFRCTRGLLTRTDVVVAKRQIQLGLTERGILSGLLGWSALKVQTLGGSEHASGRHDLAPFARSAELSAILTFTGLPPFDPAHLRVVSAWHGLGAGVGFVLIPLVGILVASVFFPAAAFLLFALPVPLTVALLRRARHRYGLAASSVQVTRGVLVQRAWTVPYGNVQAVRVRRGPIQRLLGLATVRIDTAGGSGINGPHIHDIEESHAGAFVRDLLERVQAQGKSNDQSAL